MKASRPTPPVSDADLRLLRVFKAVVDNGGFAASEVALNKSKSAISVDISSLEQRFGMRLCERGRSGFALTSQGEAVYRAVTNLLEDLDRFSADIAATSGQLSGKVTLAVIDNIGSIAADAMIAGIRDFRTRHPNVRLSIQTGSANDVERAVLDRTAQIGLSILPRLLPELEALPLFAEDQLLYCGRSHPLFNVAEAELTPDLITQFPLISLPTRSLDADPALRGFVQAAEAANLDCLVLVILAGVDIGFVPPHFARRWVQSGELRALRPDLYHLQNTFYLMSLRKAQSSPSSRELMDRLSQAFIAHPVQADAIVA